MTNERQRMDVCGRTSDESRMDVAWMSIVTLNGCQLQRSTIATADDYNGQRCDRHITTNVALQIARKFYNDGRQQRNRRDATDRPGTL
jgi:hypothetical protein